jgi:hypothetical protein
MAPEEAVRLRGAIAVFQKLPLLAAGCQRMIVYSYGGTARQRGGVGFRPLHLPGGLRFNDAERQLIR